MEDEEIAGRAVEGNAGDTAHQRLRGRRREMPRRHCGRGHKRVREKSGVLRRSAQVTVGLLVCAGEREPRALLLMVVLANAPKVFAKVERVEKDSAMPSRVV